MKKLFSLFVLLAILACAGLINQTWAAATDDKANTANADFDMAILKASGIGYGASLGFAQR